MILRLVICFLIGSIPFAVLAMAGSGVDIRKVGSGNPGFNNVLRISKARALLALIGDLGKGVVALLLVHHGVGPVWQGWALGFAAIAGHCFSPFLKFKGGKGIATSAGVMLVLYPFFAVLALLYFVAARVLGSKVMRWKEAGAIASLSAWIVFVLLMLLFRGTVDTLCAAGVAAFLFWRHKKNLQQVLARRSGVPLRSAQGRT